MTISSIYLTIQNLRIELDNLPKNFDKNKRIQLLDELTEQLGVYTAEFNDAVESLTIDELINHKIEIISVYGNNYYTKHYEKKSININSLIKQRDSIILNGLSLDDLYDVELQIATYNGATLVWDHVPTHNAIDEPTDNYVMKGIVCNCTKFYLIGYTFQYKRYNCLCSYRSYILQK